MTHPSIETIEQVLARHEYDLLGISYASENVVHAGEFEAIVSHGDRHYIVLSSHTDEHSKVRFFPLNGEERIQTFQHQEWAEMIKRAQQGGSQSQIIHPDLRIVPPNRRDPRQGPGKN